MFGLLLVSDMFVTAPPGAAFGRYSLFFSKAVRNRLYHVGQEEAFKENRDK